MVCVAKPFAYKWAPLKTLLPKRYTLAPESLASAVALLNPQSTPRPMLNQILNGLNWTQMEYTVATAVRAEGAFWVPKHGANTGLSWVTKAAVPSVVGTATTCGDSSLLEHP